MRYATRIEKCPGRADAAVNPRFFPGSIDALKTQFHHNIETLPVKASDLRWFNCYAYALGVSDKERYLDLARQYQSAVLINSTFVSDLISRGELVEAQPADVQPNDVVLYFDGDLLRHARRIISIKHRLLSGRNGDLMTSFLTLCGRYPHNMEIGYAILDPQHPHSFLHA